jgi:hypothetical protein
MNLKSFINYITGASELLPLTLVPAKKLTLNESLDIYRHGYFARLTEVLGEHFAACWKILGDENFQHLCSEYIKTHPSTEWNINRYGKSFPTMLATHLITEDYPFIAKLAALEWNKQNLFHQADDLGLSPNEIHALLENSKIKLVSSLQLATSEYNIPVILAAANNNNDQFPENWQEAAYWIMYKKNHQVYLYELSKASYLLLHSLMMGAALNEALVQYEANIEVSTNASETNMSEQVQQLFQWLTLNRLIKTIY